MSNWTLVCYGMFTHMLTKHIFGYFIFSVPVVIGFKPLNLGLWVNCSTTVLPTLAAAAIPRKWLFKKDTKISIEKDELKLFV